jgi:hypothetical protein
MLPIPHLLLFLPICVFAGLFATAIAVNLIANTAARSRPLKSDTSRKTEGRNPSSAEIIYFRPRKTSLPSGLSLGAR